MKGYLFVIFFALVFNFGCYKNEDNTKPTEVVAAVIETFINTTIAGTVNGKNGNLISDYSLIINGQTYEVKGVSFVIDLLKVKKNGQLISVWKKGKNISQGIFQLIENDVNSVTLIVFEEWDTETVTGSNWSLSSLVDIDWTESNLMTNNTLYSGNVALTARPLTEEDIISSLGFSTEGALLSLVTYGGFQFELNTLDNLELISPTKEIKLMFNNLPSSPIALFKLEESSGRLILIEDDLRNDFPVYVNKGGLYVFAKYKNGIFAQGNLHFEEKKIAFANIQYSIDNTIINGITTLQGQWLLVIPQESEGELKAINNCGEEVSNEVINSTKDNISMVNLLISDVKDLYKPNLEISNCDGQIESAPIINFQGPNNQHYYVFASSLIDQYMLICSATNISGTNNGTGQNGQTFNINSPLDILSNCEEDDDGFLGVEIEGERKNYDLIELTEENGNLILQSGGEFKLIIKGITDGSYSDDQINISINDSTLGSTGYYMSCLNSTLGCGINFCEIKRFESNGEEWTQIKFSGKLWMETITPKVAGKYTISGNLLVK